MCKYVCDSGLEDLSKLSQKKKNLLAVCIQSSPLRRHLVRFGLCRGSASSKSFFLERVIEEGVYYVCRGDIFVVNLNVHLHDVAISY